MTMTRKLPNDASLWGAWWEIAGHARVPGTTLYDALSAQDRGCSSVAYDLFVNRVYPREDEEAYFREENPDADDEAIWHMVESQIEFGWADFSSDMDRVKKDPSKLLELFGLDSDEAYVAECSCSIGSCPCRIDITPDNELEDGYWCLECELAFCRNCWDSSGGDQECPNCGEKPTTIDIMAESML